MTEVGIARTHDDQTPHVRSMALHFATAAGVPLCQAPRDGSSTRSRARVVPLDTAAHRPTMLVSCSHCDGDPRAGEWPELDGFERTPAAYGFRYVAVDS